MAKKKRKQNLAGNNSKGSSLKTTHTDEAKKGKVFDYSPKDLKQSQQELASLRKNKEYLELKRNIAFKGSNIYMIMFNQISAFKYKRR